MTTARVARAHQAEAHVYAESFYRQAEEALIAASQSLADRDYRSAIEAASIASIRADEAYARAVLRKQRMKRRARRQLREILELLDEARSLGAQARERDSLRALADRLGQLEREIESGSPAEVFDAGAALKSDALAFLHRLRER
jgi:hypothetical protein